MELLGSALVPDLSLHSDSGVLMRLLVFAVSNATCEVNMNLQYMKVAGIAHPFQACILVLPIP